MNTAAKTGRIQQRKTPRQERSIQRFDAILGAAAALIARAGVAELKMTEIAAEAGVPVGSLYQFFPEKAAILRALHDQHTSRVEAGAARIFAPLNTVAEMMEMLDFGIDTFHSVFRSDPTYLPLWLGSISDPDLQILNQRHIDRLSEILYENFRRAVPPEQQIDLETRVTMFVYLSGSISRFAMTKDPAMAKRILTEWKANMRRTLFAIDDASPGDVTIPEACARPAAVHSNADRT